MTRTRLVLAALSLVAVAGCARTDSIDSTLTTIETSTTVDSTTSTSVATSVDETTTTVVDESTTTTTTVESTTTTVAGAEATTTTPAPTTTTGGTTTTLADGPKPAKRPETAFVASDLELLEVDVASGDAVRVVDDSFVADGVFRGEVRLSADRSTLWFSEGYEDGWFGCDSSIGSIGRIDLSSGELDVLGIGIGPEPSPDGRWVAYVSSELCLPDPENPEFWVLTPYDRVVVRDVATGAERQFVTDTPPDDYSSPSQVEWAGFRPNGRLLVLTTDGQLRLVDLDGSSVIQDHPVVLSDVLGFPIGTVPGALITIDFGDEGSTDLYSVDTANGAATLLATSDGFITAGVAPSGAIIVSGFTDVSVEPDAPVTVLTTPGDTTYFDIDW